ncbi:MAG: hypothetical protein LKG80_06535 [Lachnospiraceae bacterium]|jgi:hypothetical protein|nr:hypothetical protein [Lachnospiraceae bacterium]MCH4031793.1 hypothetical protein [Lachnospiraceae bacterium]MCH4108347.1 hypothetical protein [Lachnospiraceae bacterium]MCI1380817.1 hypothetical protein [Lachnospiraceae bacterium]MCI1401437.1 hypothetical protein [Lachnospiraceae bacterium]
MGRLITLKDGTLVTVLSEKDLLYLIDTHMGQEMKEAVVEWVNEVDLQHADDEECIHELNEMISEDHARYQETMEKILEEAEKLSSLISEKELDCREIPNMVGAIRALANKEVNRC